MIPWLQIDTARVPGADVELRLMRRGAEFSMMLGQNELMNSRLSGSEEALATLACRRIRSGQESAFIDRRAGHGVHAPRRACRAGIRGADHRGRTCARRYLRGREVRWQTSSATVLTIPARAFGRPTSSRSFNHVPSAFDAILLDVDNGPEGLIRKANDALYDLKGLKAIRRALRPGGVLAVWSSGPHPPFSKRLRDAGFDVNEVDVRATTKRSGARHVIWFATEREGAR